MLDARSPLEIGCSGRASRRRSVSLLTWPHDGSRIRRCAAHGNEQDVATIEVVIESEELRTLTQPAGPVGVYDPQVGSSSGDHEVSSRSSDLPARARGRARSNSRARLALLVCTSAAALLLAVGDARVARVAGEAAPPLAAAIATPLEHPTPLPKQPAVRFANPFDATEVFEFPAGTSKSTAREAVAKLLTERARGRLYLLSAKRARHHRPRPPHPVKVPSARPPESSSAA